MPCTFKRKSPSHSGNDPNEGWANKSSMLPRSRIVVFYNRSLATETSPVVYKAMNFKKWNLVVLERSDLLFLEISSIDYIYCKLSDVHRSMSTRQSTRIASLQGSRGTIAPVFQKSEEFAKRASPARLKRPLKIDPFRLKMDLYHFHVVPVSVSSCAPSSRTFYRSWEQGNFTIRDGRTCQKPKNVSDFDP